MKFSYRLYLFSGNRASRWNDSLFTKVVTRWTEESMGLWMNHWSKLSQWWWLYSRITVWDSIFQRFIHKPIDCYVLDKNDKKHWQSLPYDEHPVFLAPDAPWRSRSKTGAGHSLQEICVACTNLSVLKACRKTKSSVKFFDTFRISRSQQWWLGRNGGDWNREIRTHEIRWEIRWTKTEKA